MSPTAQTPEESSPRPRPEAGQSPCAPWRRGGLWIVLAVALSWLAIQQTWFYSRPLENRQPANVRLSREDVAWLAIVPDRFGIWSNLVTQFETPQYLRQRLIPFATAALIVGWALVLGDLLTAMVFHSGYPDRSSRLLAAYGLGMAGVGLTTQILGWFGGLSRTAFAVAAVVSLVLWLLVARPWRKGPVPMAVEKSALPRWLIAAVAPFVLLAFLAAALPTIDYDALGYHLLVPKEYWLNGRITFLPHNVYSNFPFLTEMFPLLGMVILDDWFFGGLTGQIVLASFGPATALAVALLAQRVFGSTAAVLAALFYLTTPWVYRLMTIPYAEGGLMFFTAAALYAAWRSDEGNRWVMLSGLLAGAGFGCKYPALLMTIVPAAGLAMVRRPRLSTLALLGLGVAITATPWLARNAAWTGNPVYPLASSIFPSSHWRGAKVERFEQGHRSADFSPATFRDGLLEIGGGSYWQSGILAALAPLSLLGTRRKSAAALWGIVAYQFLVYWGLTHRLDRFFLPLEPTLCVLAAGGAVWSTVWVWRCAAGAVVIGGLFFNLAYCTTPLVGLNHYTAELRQQWQANVLAWPALAVANDPRIVPPDATVLFVGLAAVYNAIPSAQYSTVFDDNLLEILVRDPDSKRDNPADQLYPPSQAWRRLRERRIDFVLIDWGEIARYRSPGNYGYTPFVVPAVFERLARQGVLVPMALGGIESVSLYRVSTREPVE